IIANVSYNQLVWITYKRTQKPPPPTTTIKNSNAIINFSKITNKSRIPSNVRVTNVSQAKNQ
ncbi:MAG: hypothetical protein ACK53Y_09060, partial [bacterium]